MARHGRWGAVCVGGGGGEDVCTPLCPDEASIVCGAVRCGAVWCGALPSASSNVPFNHDFFMVTLPDKRYVLSWA